jgi:hypothetical protein
MGTRDSRCDRAREWISLRADAELSELESALLAAHLKRCPGCGSFAVGVGTATVQLRAASLERLRRPVGLPRRRAASPLRAVQLGAAAALVVAAVGLGALFGSLRAQPNQARLTLKLPQNAALLAFDSSPRGLPTTRQAALAQRPPAPVPRRLSLADV